MTIFLILVLAAAASAVFWRRRFARAAAAGAAIAMYVWAWDPFTALFSATLERRFPPQPFPAGDADAIVVLSGSFYPPDESQIETLPGYGTYLRCHHAALLYRLWKALPVVVTTGPVRSRGRLVDTAPAMVRILEDEGVPPAMIWSENRSRNTFENAAHTAALLRQKGIGRIALVTEAFHMARSARVFERQGLAVLAAPCARRAPRFEATWKDLVFPRPENIAVNEANLHEWAGLLWYSISGRI